MAAVNREFWAPRAWVGGRWREQVRLAAGADGCWAAVDCGVAPPPGAERLAGDVLPTLVDAHSHAFQRAFVGLSERRDDAHDDFWSWRDRMYGVALKLRPEQLRAVAAHLYAELLAGGYSQVCEFHYLHHDLDGRPYAEPAEMSLALADAAQDAGIGLTLLPVLYERAGFQADALRPDQRRFATTPQQVLDIASALRGRAGVSVGAAVHSLRAARPASIAELAAACDGPLHVHVAEQTAEVDDCLAATGCRPIEWLARHAGLDARWQLVHATHATPGEIEAVAASGAGVVICPATEADLGDGFCDLPRWLDAGVPLAVGSDSQVVRAWPEELRWLEWGQRLLHRRRNVSAAPGVEPSSAARLFERLRAGGGTAAGFARWGLEVGARADLVELDPAEPALAGLPPGHRLDGLVFGAPAAPFKRTLVGGRWVAADREGIRARFEAVMAEIWAGS
ncbi:formimidoylglutamate deiminase [Rubrivivax benzoatilyticus]|uniref:Formimidoylglutamate deiminase n=1 Tax=Rubrivivax benzoatilyticus TaxID=316997 RepID=A0ABX0HXH8_9BURK|nr:formimidoylglutamate deiminase [Rubrivivax benzoatilyticus]EGJ08968.1 N-formimino-L-glutamate deiminase [Rubrivivax benzoatilyticus JA2 = ATCC BAA-35]NHK99711.1 formimidoylglutamate deiminase [Rubrivivax benzoatilyticus]NHL25584.1 formimidoylglutamate deiminase [Rubrivivax benzoatilyticus]